MDFSLLIAKDNVQFEGLIAMILKSVISLTAMRVVWYKPAEVSEEYIASIFRVCE
jgi:hypothetical protein